MGQRVWARWPSHGLLQGIHPAPQEPVFVLAVLRGLGQRAGNSTELDGLKDDRRMNLIEGPDHLNAKVLVSAEEHGVEDGAPGQHPSLEAMRRPRCQHLGA